MKPKKIACKGCGELFPLDGSGKEVCKQECADLAAALEADEMMFRTKLQRQYGEKVFTPPPADPVFSAPPARKPTAKRRSLGLKKKTLRSSLKS